jgi:hypothetical protein
MLKSTTSAFVLALFLADAQAVKYRPYTNGRSPWYKEYAKEPTVDHDINYFVPNFGLDHNIKASLANTANAEERLKHKFTATFEKPKGHPMNYKVPNFGVDHDIKTTQANIAETEKDLKHQFTASFAQPKGHPVNYPVPNFGKDHEIITSQTNTANAEKSLKHIFNASFETPKGPPMNYPVPNFGQDSDIKISLENTKNAETKLGVTWNPPALVQAEEEVNVDSDPICSSSGCNQYKHKKAKLGYPINYPVANHGPDPDMVGTLNHEKLASTMVNHNWEFGTEASKAKYANKAKDTDYNFAPKLDDDMTSTAQHLTGAETTLKHKWVIDDSKVQLESDPICSSAGCTQYKHKKPKLGYPINYPVPNNGADPDMVATLEHEKLASTMVNHHWDFGTEESKAKWHNKAKDTDYNFAPALDGDMISTAKHLTGAEA